MAKTLPSETTRRKWFRRRGFRWSLRAFLIATAIIGVLVGLHAKRVSTRRTAIARLAGISPRGKPRIEYDYQFDDQGIIPNARSSVPAPLLRFLGPDFFHEIVGVSLDGDHIHVTELQMLRSLPGLKRLDVEYDTLSRESLETIEKLVALERLDLQETGIGDDDLAHVSPLNNLRILLLSGRGISDDGLTNLSGLKHLKNLALRECSVSGSGLVHLKCPSLRTLDVKKSPISDASIDHICRLQSLEELNLFGTQVTSTGIVKLINLTNLKRLQLPKDADQDAIDVLNEALPGCRIERTEAIGMGLPNR